MQKTVAFTEDETSFDQSDMALHIERLIPAVESILRTTGGLSEHELIKTLQQSPWRLLGKVHYADPAALYPVHFLLFHVLYRLRDELVVEHQETLQISPLRIQIMAAGDRPSQDIGETDPLSDFYHDLDNLTLSRDAIEQMMDDFWRGQDGSHQGVIRQGELAEACATLEVDCPPESFQQTKQQFRKLAMVHHPDRGGSTRQLQSINQAMAVIRHYFQEEVKRA